MRKAYLGFTHYIEGTGDADDVMGGRLANRMMDRLVNIGEGGDVLPILPGFIDQCFRGQTPIDSGSGENDLFCHRHQCRQHGFVRLVIQDANDHSDGALFCFPGQEGSQVSSGVQIVGAVQNDPGRLANDFESSGPAKAVQALSAVFF